MRVLFIIAIVLCAGPAFAICDISETDKRISATFSLQAAAEKCEFKVDDQKVVGWMKGSEPLTAKQMGLINLLTLYYRGLIEQTTPEQCVEWRRVAIEKGWLITP